jgi:PAS domain S-box-containing protein
LSTHSSEPVDNLGLDFLTGGGEMGALIRAFDWSSTAIGSPQTWSPTLRTMVRILLANRFPMLLWWGPEYISIYNDAYRPILGRKHPWGLGRPVRECWSEIWHILKPLIDTPFYGGPSTWIEDIELEINRLGFSEETHFTVAYSPVPEEGEGTVGGVLATVHEITEKVVGARRGIILRDLGALAIDARSAEEVCRLAAAIFDRNRKDIPFAALYLVEEDAKAACLAASSGLQDHPELTPEMVDLSPVSDAAPWPLASAPQAFEMRRVASLPGLPPGSPQAVVIPVRANTPQQQAAGFLIAGLTPSLPFDDAYRGFLDLSASQISSAIASARAHEQERRRAEALAEIDRAKTNFFNNVSHEFRTPLTLLLGPLESTLTMPGALTPEAYEQIRTAHRNSLRLLKLVNSLLDFARIEAGRVKARFAPVDLTTITQGLASNFHSAFDAAGLQFKVDCKPLPKQMFVDREMWEKIVLNLLSNAFKFTFEGTISVSLRAEDQFAVLEVADTGTGIPDSEIPHIFDRFHRVEDSRGRTHEGAGIGLALILELVKIHGGSIDVKSRMGEGSTFTVRIPAGSDHLAQDRIVNPPAENSFSKVARAEAYTEEALTWSFKDLPPIHPQPLGETSPIPRVLVVDDNADMRDHLRRILSSRYDVVLASNGLDALAAARRHKPDAILTDVMMPHLDGFGLLQQLREDNELREVPVIVLSARAGEEARTEGMNAGADDYVTKPFSANELLARVESTLKLQRSRRAAREQFESLLNQAPLGVYLVDAGFRIHHVNPTARAIFGDIPGLIGRDFTEVMRILWTEEYAQELTTIFRNTLETGEPYVTPEHVEYRIDRGVSEWYEWRIHRILLPDGTYGVVCNFRDISEQVRTRAEIAHSEERFRAFVTATSDVVYRMSADWTEMQNLRGRDFIADTADSSFGWLQKYIHPDDQPTVLKAIRKAIDNKSPFELEHRVIRVDGSLGWTFSRAVPLLDEDGEILDWFGTARDITETKNTETAIARLTTESEQQRRLYQTILSNTPDFIYVFDLNHRFTYANKALLEMWGKTAEESIGRNCLELGYEPWHAAMHDREIEHVISTKLPIRGEVPFTGTHGRRIYDYIFVPVIGADGEVEAIAGTTRDVTDRKMAEEDLRRANSDLEQFAYTASHDLQEPLRSVKIYTELLTTRYGSKLDGQALEFFDFVRSGANRMEMLVRDLLAYTQTTVIDAPIEPADLNDAISAANRNLARAISESGATIEVMESLPSIRIRHTHLQQLFQNLIGNAIKYRRPGIPPLIRITTETDGQYYKFCVADNGLGIEPEYTSRIFGLFKRLHGDEYPGTGIGLAICQRIVERYRGRIWAESEPGHGSKFYFTIPA